MAAGDSSRNSRTATFVPPEALEELSNDVGSLWCPKSVPVLDRPPSPSTFYRDYVSQSTPCIIKNAVPASRRVLERLPRGRNDKQSDSTAEEPLILSLDDLVSLCGGKDISLGVDVSPDGHADCVRTVSKNNLASCRTADTQRSCARMFVKPQEMRMSLVEFRDRLRAGRQTPMKKSSRDEGERSDLGSDDCGLEVVPLSDSEVETDIDVGSERPIAHPSTSVVYYSRQNDCLRTELRALFETKIIPDSFDFAEEAFRTGSPDAVNLWIGDERAVSSMHKDHYENLFYVLSGRKIFTLCAPADVPFLREGEFECGSFSFGSGSDGGQGWCVVPEYEEKEDISPQRCAKIAKWIEPDIDAIGNPGIAGIDTVSYSAKFPLLRKAHPLRVEVSEGEMLYLPSLWFHRVTQSCETVGVNWWYDMKFDSPYWCYFNFLQQLKTAEVGAS